MTKKTSIYSIIIIRNVFINIKILFNVIIDITLNKTIPIGAGLGGGSSNAVSVVKGLAKLFDIQVNEEAMKLIVSNTGADIPFFIKGGRRC